MSQVPPEVPSVPPQAPFHAQPNRNLTTTPEKAPGLALVSLLCGILSVLGGVVLLIPPVAAIVCGHVARGQCNSRGVKAGLGTSLAGLIMGYLSLAMIPIVGLLAAMAIPAFQKVRTVSQEKVMLNNARMISAAAEQFYLENGVTSAEVGQLVGQGKYIKEIVTIDQEKYPLTVAQGRPIIVVKKDGRTVQYVP